MQCISPITIKAKQVISHEMYAHHLVPCNKCEACHKRRASQWVFRLQQELKRSSSAHFLTCTYTDTSLTHTKDGRPTLNYSDHQKFIKRLRKSCGNSQPLKYYAVGEYGEKFERPHYHYIMFNLPDASQSNLEAIWTNGIVDIGSVTAGAMAYVTGYINKKVISSYIKGETRLPERSFMSKGLGQNYLTPATKSYYERKLLPYLHTTSGNKIPMPRYYKEKLYNPSQLNHVNNEAKIYILENELTEKEQFEQKKALWQKGERNKKYRSTKLFY